MFRHLGHLSPSLALSLVALFVALGGTAVAAGIVPRARLADNALKLQGKSAAQIGALAPKGADGAVGPAGPAGPAGSTGPPGATPASLASYVTYKAAPWSLNAGQEGDFTVACDAGQKAVGGGWDNQNGTALSVDTRPSAAGGGWRVYLLGVTSASGSVYAACLK
jgi:hypothetical protein